MLSKFIIAVSIRIILVYGAKTGWYKNGVFYHVYVRSFKDSDNDGIGDLRGVIEKLDHLYDLGVTVAWLSPIFKSPQVDHGYDISDYSTIDPIYGNMNDLTELLGEAERFGIKILLDLVPNHTSDQHYWFGMSVNRELGYEDYYVWIDPKIDSKGNRLPPNNWLSIFSNSAWTWNEKRQQYYLHQFDPSQPDLNLRNREVIDEFKRVSTFYLDLGVAGFRVDAVPYLIEDERLLDESFLSDMENSDAGHWFYYEHVYTKNSNESYDFVYDYRSFIDEYNRNVEGDERIIITEAYTSFDKTALYYGNEDGTKLGAHFTLNFDFTYFHFNTTANDVKKVIETWMSRLFKEYPLNWGLSNHDNHRGPTRLGNVDGYNMLVTFLPGVVGVYYAEEIGQENGVVECEEGTDPKAVNNCETFHLITRDYERTPFQWDGTVNAGFNSGGRPWLRVGGKFRITNLASQNVPGMRSHYNIYKDMVKLRKNMCEYDEVAVSARSANKNVLHIVRKKIEEEEDSHIFKNSIHLLPQESLVLKTIIPGYSTKNISIPSTSSNTST